MNKTPHTITDELLDQLLANYQKPEDLIGTDGILKQLTKKLVERALDAELTHHLGHNKHQPVSNWMGNTRNCGQRQRNHIGSDSHRSLRPGNLPGRWGYAGTLQADRVERTGVEQMEQAMNRREVTFLSAVDASKVEIPS
ncbi:transposase, partial [Pseudomonas aeruginosa]|uniref:transposase n=1 Tax=Pseudomonas aeruginosa TaxID=287 RepID=UPI0021AD7E31